MMSKYLHPKTILLINNLFLDVFIINQNEFIMKHVKKIFQSIFISLENN